MKELVMGPLTDCAIAVFLEHSFLRKQFAVVWP